MAGIRGFITVHIAMAGHLRVTHDNDYKIWRVGKCELATLHIENIYILVPLT